MQHVLQHHRMLIGDGGGRTAADDGLLGHHLVEGGRTAGMLPDAAIGHILRHRADPAELLRIEQRRLVADQRLHRRRRREHGERQAVGRVLGVDLVGRRQRTRARHVGRHHGRLAGQEAAIMPRQHPHIGVVAAAGREAGDQRHGLALVEIGDRFGLRRSRRRSRRATSVASAIAACPMSRMAISLVIPRPLKKPRRRTSIAFTVAPAAADRR